MKKFYFVFMAKGYRNKMMLLGQMLPCPKMDAVFYSPIRHVYGVDQQHADDQVQAMLGDKWIGFMTIPEDKVPPYAK